MEEFVPYELAVKLKEKGFIHDYNLYGYKPIYTDVDTMALIWNNGAYEKDYFGENIPCPSISEVLKWLRDEKKLYVEPCVLSDTDTDADNKVVNEYTYWSFSITHIETGDMIYFKHEHIYDDKRFDSYEEAALAGIDYILDNLI